MPDEVALELLTEVSGKSARAAWEDSGVRGRAVSAVEAVLRPHLQLKSLPAKKNSSRTAEHDVPEEMGRT